MTFAAFVPMIIAAAASAASSLLQKKPKSKQFPSLSENQTDFQDQLIQMLQGQLGGGGEGGSAFGNSQDFLKNLLSGSPESTKAFEAPYLRQFNEEIVPGLANRFSGLGAGSQSSSYFQKALAKAGTNLEERLASLRGGLQLQGSGLAQNALFGLLPSAFASRFNTGVTPGSPGPAAQFLAPITEGYGKQFGESVGKGNFSELAKQFPRIFGEK